MRQTIGWVDPSGDINEQDQRKRRVWAKLVTSILSLSAVRPTALTGLKKALQEGYIVRRSCMGGYEYSAKWRESHRNTSTPEIPLS